MKKYCEEYLTEKHIWSSIHHPQTLGKLSNFQKGLKRFLRHRLGNSGIDPQAIDECMSIYVNWYNNGKKVSTSGCYPEERYSGKRDAGCYARLVKALKLEDVLPILVDSRSKIHAQFNNFIAASMDDTYVYLPHYYPQGSLLLRKTEEKRAIFDLLVEAVGG